MSSAPDLTKADEVEFSVKSEPWAKYKLDDGTTLYAKYVLTKAYRTDIYDPTGCPVYSWSAQTLLTTLVPNSKRRVPSNPQPVSTNFADFTTTQMDFDRIGVEEWNVYELADRTIYRIRMEVINVLKTNSVLPDGDPYYLVSHTTIPRLKVYPSLIKKQVPKIAHSKDGGVYK